LDKITKLALRRAQSRIATPVIIEVKDGVLMEIAEELKNYQFQLRSLIDRLFPLTIPIFPTKMRVMRKFNMIALTLPREIIFMLADDRRVNKIYSDELKWALAYPTVPPEGIYATEHRQLRKKISFTSTYWTKKLIGADQANKDGFTGKGVSVAVLDTGISKIHEQTPRNVEAYTVYPFQYIDENGHGQWCASCIAGRRAVDDVLSKSVSRNIICEGMAPDVKLIAIKVLGYIVGVGTDSGIIEGIELASTLDSNILSMSLGGPVNNDRPEDDPFYPVFNKIKEEGRIAVVAAGNEGPDSGTIGTPGWLDEVLTVGAYDPITGEVAKYSSRGPTKDGRIKPDVIAPGGGIPDHGIDSAIVNFLDTAGDGMINRYSPIQGTSMATPHVAGLAALMRQAHKQLLNKILTVDEIKEMMAELGEEKNNNSGWGLISWGLYKEWLETQYGLKI